MRLPLAVVTGGLDVRAGQADKAPWIGPYATGGFYKVAGGGLRARFVAAIMDRGSRHNVEVRAGYLDRANVCFNVLWVFETGSAP